MKIQDEVKQLAHKGSKRGGELRLPKGIVDAEIAGFERRTGLVMPQPLRDWLKFTNAPRIGSGLLFGICAERKSRDIEVHYTIDYLNWQRKGWIPIADDGCGNQYVLATREEDGPGNPVFFVETTLDPSKPAYVVASDLWHFLRFYFLSESGQRGWPFNKREVLAQDPNLAQPRTAPRPWEVDV